LLQLYSRSMPLVDVDLRSLAERTAGRSGADIKALCQQAALQAAIRIGQADAAAQVTSSDFAAALLDPAAGSPPEAPGVGGYI
jgi:SpoVK/Ycf46/Vps4 family AAA+-type ATPase